MSQDDVRVVGHMRRAIAYSGGDGRISGERVFSERKIEETDIQLVPLSLLAEAESDRDKWRSDATEIANKCAIDIASLQSRLDAVSDDMREAVKHLNGGYINADEVIGWSDALRAALGGESHGNEEVRS